MLVIKQTREDRADLQPQILDQFHQLGRFRAVVDRKVEFLVQCKIALGVELGRRCVNLGDQSAQGFEVLVAKIRCRKLDRETFKRHPDRQKLAEFGFGHRGHDDRAVWQDLQQTLGHQPLQRLADRGHGNSVGVGQAADDKRLHWCKPAHREAAPDLVVRTVVQCLVFDFIHKRLPELHRDLRLVLALRPSNCAGATVDSI